MKKMAAMAITAAIALSFEAMAFADFVPTEQAGWPQLELVQGRFRDAMPKSERSNLWGKMHAPRFYMQDNGAMQPVSDLSDAQIAKLRKEWLPYRMDEYMLKLKHVPPKDYEYGETWKSIGYDMRVFVEGSFLLAFDDMAESGTIEKEADKLRQKGYKPKDPHTKKDL